MRMKNGQKKVFLSILIINKETKSVNKIVVGIWECNNRFRLIILIDTTKYKYKVWHVYNILLLRKAKISHKNQ
jgi:hypothetical protein